MSSDESRSLIERHLHNDNLFNSIIWNRLPERSSYINPTRHQVLRFLTSKAGHYAVLILVSFDVSCIFADILISLFVCEENCQGGNDASKGLKNAQEALGIVSLIFSSLFMVELLASVWAFGPR